ncbi:MAG TPA: (d)CMP kinase [Desulfurobacteriaceae bacterium]|nr:(d)CMP kinase [Desulfurobacteriaceae bacterium]
MIITIDGPAGVGKSTLAKKISKNLGFIFINSGAIYRSLAYYILKHNINLQEIEKHLDKIQLNIEGNFEKIYLNGVDITCEIYHPEVSKIASLIAKNSKVRDFVNNFIRNFAIGKNVVIEGRDTGSVVFPNADIKFYLDANVEERAKRRYKDLILKGIKVNFEKLKEEIEKRDLEDKTRKIAPLTIPKGAIYIDTSYLSFEEVYEKVIKVIKNKLCGNEK